MYLDNQLETDGHSLQTNQIRKNNEPGSRTGVPCSRSRASVASRRPVKGWPTAPKEVWRPQRPVSFQ